MTTDEHTTHDVYEHLEQLQHVRMREATMQATQQVQEALEQIRPVIENAKRVLVDHEARGERVRAYVLDGIALTPMAAGEVEQGLWELMQEMSGARRLHYALQALSIECDPDEALRPERVEEARLRVDVERLSPAALAMLRSVAQEEGKEPST